MLTAITVTPEYKAVISFSDCHLVPATRICSSVSSAIPATISITIVPLEYWVWTICYLVTANCICLLVSIGSSEFVLRIRYPRLSPTLSSPLEYQPQTIFLVLLRGGYPSARLGCRRNTQMATSDEAFSGVNTAMFEQLSLYT